MKTTKSLDEILENVKGFRLQAIHNIKSALNNIARKTGEQEAKIAVAKTGLKYSEEEAIKIVNNLSNIAHKTRDSKATIAAATAIEKYGEKTARNVAYWLSYFAYSSIGNTKHIIEMANIMSLDEIVKTLEGYDEESERYYESVIHRLIRYAYVTRDAKATSELAKIISLNGDTLKRYNKETAVRIARGLLAIAYWDRGLEATKAAAKAIKIYSGEETAESIASHLAEIADATCNLEATKAAAKAIGKYDKETARDVASWLSNIAYNTADPKITTVAAETIGKYNKETAGYIAGRLSDFIHLHYASDNFSIIKLADIMSLSDIVETVGKYEGEAARNIIEELFFIARFTPEATLAAAKAIRRYNAERATNIARWFENDSRNTRDAKHIIGMADIMSLSDIVETVGKYEGESGENVIFGLLEWAEKARDAKATNELAKIISPDGNTLKRYNKETAGKISSELSAIAGRTGNLEATKAAAKVIGSYKGKAAEGVARGLRDVAFYTKDAKAVIKAANIMSLDKIVNIVGRYERESVSSITKGLAHIIYLTMDKEVVIAACDLVNKVGSNLFDILDSNEIVKLHDKRLDKLIETKGDFNSVEVYLKSNGELPLPTRYNIKSYNNKVADYLSKEYGIKKEIKDNQLFMLFSVEKEERKLFAELMNNSYEKNRKTYSIGLETGEELKIDRNMLPYFSLISVIGSRNISNEKEALSTMAEIVGEKAVNRARNAFNSHYKNLRNKIIAYVNNKDINEALKLLKDTGDEAIKDVISTSEYRNLSELNGKNVLEAVESNNPLDYDSRVQIACVYLPSNNKGGVVDYCKDKRFKLIRYDVNGNAIGSAICYIENDNFLVDSVEGHRTFRKKKIFDAVYKDLINRAKEYGARRIIFSTSVYNDTPNQFIEHIKGYGLKSKRIKMTLDTEGYLEAYKEGTQGYILDFSG